MAIKFSSIYKTVCVPARIRFSNVREIIIGEEIPCYWKRQKIESFLKLEKTSFSTNKLYRPVVFHVVCHARFRVSATV
jgi:hypothetical protein